MFNFGNDDKEKLKQNMEQIKQMVEDDESETVQEGFSQTQSPQQDFEPAQAENQSSFENSDTFESEEEPIERSGQGFNQEETGTQKFEEQEEEEIEHELDEFEEKFGGESNSRKRETSASERGKTSEEVNQLRKEVPSPPEKRDIEVPEIDRGPLFLRQKKFLGAKNMINEMLYLVEDLERTVNDLERGIEDDQAIEREAREILMGMEDNRSEVQDIISPKEE